MYLFLASPSFKSFVSDPNVSTYLNVVQNLGVLEPDFNKTMSVVLFNCLKNTYEMGDVSSVFPSMFNFLFCVDSHNSEHIVSLSSMKTCAKNLGRLSDCMKPDDSFRLVLPPFHNVASINKFTDLFGEYYVDAGINRTLAVLKVDLAKSILRLTESGSIL